MRTFTKKRYRYVGKEKDLESGLYYYGARYYLPWTCRFISIDPLAAQYAQLTPYNYADNNPVNDFDIDGMQDNNSGSSEGSKAGDIPGQNTDAQGNSIPWQDGDIWEDKATGIKYATYNGQWGATTDPVNITPQERNSPVVIESDKYYRPTANGYIESGLVYSDAIKGSDLIQKMNEWQVQAEKQAELSAMERYAKYEAAAQKQAVYEYNRSQNLFGIIYLVYADPAVQIGKQFQKGNYSAATADIAIAIFLAGMSKTVKQGKQLLLTGGKLHKHHVLPQQYRKWFAQRGISNIDDYAIQIGQSTHLKGVHGKGLGAHLPGGWNKQWGDFIKANPNASPSEIFHHAEGLLKRYGLENSRYVPYK